MTFGVENEVWLEMPYTDERIPKSFLEKFLSKLNTETEAAKWTRKEDPDCKEYTIIPVDRIPLSWTQPSSITGCLSSQLEIFEYREYGFRDEEEEFLTYILAHSKCLKTVTISLNPSFDLEDQEFIIDDLKDIPRVSTSQLLFRKVS